MEWTGNEPEIHNSNERVDENIPLVISESCPVSGGGGGGGEDDVSIPETPLYEDHNSNFENSEVDDEAEEANRNSLERTLRKETTLAQGRDSVRLECFAPGGTPIQGKSYTITAAGATLGRKQLNTIAFSHNILVSGLCCPVG